MKNNGLRVTMEIALVGYVLAALGYGYEMKRRSTPPLRPVFEEIKREFYLEYLTTGQVPADLTLLSPRAAKLLTVYCDSLEWDQATGSLHYAYDKGYPMNSASILRTFTFGIVSDDPTLLGEGLTPDDVRHNAPLWRAAGRL